MCLFLPLNFKSYSVMVSNVISEDMLKSSDSIKNPIISVLISNYPLANGGYLVSFGKEGPDGSFNNYDPVYFSDYETTKLSMHLDFSSVFLPKGCYYLPDMELAGFIKALSFGTSTFEMKILPASGQMQGLLLIKVDEESFSKYEPKEEN